MNRNVVAVLNTDLFKITIIQRIDHYGNFLTHNYPKRNDSNLRKKKKKNLTEKNIRYFGNTELKQKNNVYHCNKLRGGV